MAVETLALTTGAGTVFPVTGSQIGSYPMPEVRQRTRIPRRARLWLPSVVALAVCALLLANWLSPVGFRLNQRFLDAPVLFGALLLLSAFASKSGQRMRETWQRLLLRSLGALSRGCRRRGRCGISLNARGPVVTVVGHRQVEWPLAAAVPVGAMMPEEAKAMNTALEKLAEASGNVMHSVVSTAASAPMSFVEARIATASNSHRWSL